MSDYKTIGKSSLDINGNTEKKKKMSMLDNPDPEYNVTVDDARAVSEVMNTGKAYLNEMFIDELHENESVLPHKPRQKKRRVGQYLGKDAVAAEHEPDNEPKRIDVTEMMNQAIEDNINKHDDPYKHQAAQQAFAEQAEEMKVLEQEKRIHAARLAYMDQVKSVSRENLSAESIEHMNLRSKAKQEELALNPPPTIFGRIATELDNMARQKHNEAMHDIMKAATIAAQSGGYSGADFGLNTSHKTGGTKANTQDMINKPDHYHKGGIDVYEIMQAKFSEDAYRGFCLGNILKYTLRHELKGGMQDLEKAHFNLERLIESHKGDQYVPTYKKEAK